MGHGLGSERQAGSVRTRIKIFIYFNFVRVRVCDCDLFVDAPERNDHEIQVFVEGGEFLCSPFSRAILVALHTRYGEPGRNKSGRRQGKLRVCELVILSPANRKVDSVRLTLFSLPQRFIPISCLCSALPHGPFHSLLVSHCPARAEVSRSFRTVDQKEQSHLLSTPSLNLISIIDSTHGSVSILSKVFASTRSSCNYSPPSCLTTATASETTTEPAHPTSPACGGGCRSRSTSMK
jgi:hypothetical protein